MNDGHENDNNPANTGSETPSSQGIFSTPELTVNSNNIPSVNSSDERSRVASVFANTDAGQRSSQLNDAMNLPQQPTQPATEDVIINTGPRKRSKMPLIIASIVVLLVVAGLVIFNVVRSIVPANNPQTAQEAFEDYYNYLANGTEELRSNNDNYNGQVYFLFQIDELNLTSEQTKTYINTLKDRFNNFTKLAENNPNFSIDNYEQYPERFALAVSYNGLSLTLDELTDKYFQGGAAEAYAFAKNIVSTNYKDIILKNFSNDLINYLTDEVNLYQIYSASNCFDQFHQLNNACINTLYDNNSTFNDLINKQSQESAMLPTYNGFLSKNFAESTEEIKQQLGASNE